MARKPNYNFEKRRKEEVRKQRQKNKPTCKREEKPRCDDVLTTTAVTGTPDSQPSASGE